jgi:hypothetical protein
LVEEHDTSIPIQHRWYQFQNRLTARWSSRSNDSIIMQSQQQQQQAEISSEENIVLHNHNKATRLYSELQDDNGDV